VRSSALGLLVVAFLCGGCTAFKNPLVAESGPVSGSVETKGVSQTATITSSEQELRAIVLDRAGDAFAEKPLLEFRRAP